MIGERNNWTCQHPQCDKSFQAGDMVHAAHHRDHHHKDDPRYNDPSVGKILCVEHHLEQHKRGTSLGKRGDDYAVRALTHTDRKTWDYREHPEKYKK